MLYILIAAAVDSRMLVDYTNNMCETMTPDELFSYKYSSSIANTLSGRN